jgi:hypothetical protein
MPGNLHAVGHAEKPREKKTVDAPRNIGLISEWTKGRLVQALVPRGFLMPGTKLGGWFEKNPVHLYEQWDLLVLRSNEIPPSSVIPVAVVKGFHLVHDHEGSAWKYDVSIHYWDGLQHDELVSKWHLESGFIKVPASDIDEARKMYLGKARAH